MHPGRQGVGVESFAFGEEFQPAFLFGVDGVGVEFVQLQQPDAAVVEQQTSGAVAQAEVVGELGALGLNRSAPVPQASDAGLHTSTWRKTLLIVRPFAPGWKLLRPLLTSRSGFIRRPFRHEARSPQVRTHSFSAQPPDLRHFTLITRASRSHACSPCSAAPSIRFLPIGSQITIHASSPRSVALTPLRFTSFAAINLRRDLHPQECAHAKRPRWSEGVWRCHQG